MRLAGADKTGLKLVEHVFDANILTDSKVVGKWLQESIDEVTGSDLKTGPDNNRSYDGIMGSKTRTALKKAVEQGKTKEISNKFANKRIEFLRGLSNYSDNPGWEPRVEKLRD
ncbi:MAG: hypothetical protein ACRBDL_00565 [Alphaproteobacteria bacterium]